MRLQTAGSIQFLSDPVQTDASTQVYGRDPDGNLFSLIQPVPNAGISIKALKTR